MYFKLNFQKVRSIPQFPAYRAFSWLVDSILINDSLHKAKIHKWMSQGWDRITKTDNVSIS